MDKKILENKIVKKLLNNRNITNEEEIERFFNPSLEFLRDPFLYSNVEACVNRIKEAIDKKQSVLICGDYDVDGIGASYILYSYFKKYCNLVADVHIPSRIDEGYGISLDFIKALEKKPDLVITVDCGISCSSEIDELQKMGIEVVVTDHHNIPNELPRCLIFDPKLDSGKLFDGFCGAGVVLKLVQALSGKEIMKKYLDMACISTVGDIVPLVDENRVIVKFGLEKLNNNPTKNLQILLNYLNLKDIHSTELPFKLVPFLNSAGRVGLAEHVFEMLIEEDESKVLAMVEQINTDNETRLASKEIGLKEVDVLVKDVDLNKEKIIILKSDKFDEGVVGIIASMVSNKYKRPAIIFSEKENVLKGSGRSYGNFNLHNVVMQYENLCIKVGGHDYACGLSLNISNFEIFKNSLLVAIQNENFDEVDKYEFEIDVEDIDNKLFEYLAWFEPFGLDNPKPKFMLKAQKMSYDYLSLKSHKHYLLNVDGLKIICFFGEKYLQTFDSKEIKELIIELNQNKFNSRTNNQIILRDVNTKDVFTFCEDDEQVVACELWNCYQNLNEGYDAVEIDYDGLCEIVMDTEEFGTVFVARSVREFEDIKKVLKACDKKLPIKFLAYEDGRSMVCLNWNLDVNAYSNYKRVVYLQKPIIDINVHSDFQELYFLDLEDERRKISLSCDRGMFVNIYSLFMKFISDNKTFDDEMDIVNIIEKMQNVATKSEIMLILCVFLEKNIIKTEKCENDKIKILKGDAVKICLEDSKIYKMVNEIL